MLVANRLDMTNSPILGHGHINQIRLHSPISLKRTRTAIQTRASLTNGPAYNKYRSRQDIERDYFKDWERTTLLAEEELQRPMTPLTFLAFLPTWFRYYAVPGPVRFLLYCIWKQLAVVGYKVHKKLVLQGAKLDASLAKKISPSASFDRRVVLLRLHRKIPVMQDIMYRLKLLKGEMPTVVVATKNE